MQAQAQAVNVKTDLTCWKCGEETLTEKVEAVDPKEFRSLKLAVSAIMQSECTKCGAQSVNAAQARHNKIIGRRNRKAIIKEANRKAS